MYKRQFQYAAPFAVYASASLETALRDVHVFFPDFSAADAPPRAEAPILEADVQRYGMQRPQLFWLTPEERGEVALPQTEDPMHSQAAFTRALSMMPREQVDAMSQEEKQQLMEQLNGIYKEAARNEAARQAVKYTAVEL